MQISVLNSRGVDYACRKCLRIKKMIHDIVLTTMVIALVIDAIGSTKELKK